MTINSNYDNKRHLKLLQKSLNLRRKDKYLFYQNQKGDRESIKYQIFVYDHIFWTHKNDFISKNFINGTINYDEFEINFSLLCNKTIQEYKIFRMDLEKIENFQPDS